MSWKEINRLRNEPTDKHKNPKNVSGPSEFSGSAMVCIEISSTPPVQSAAISRAIQNAFDFSSLMSIITAYQAAQATADGFGIVMASSPNAVQLRMASGLPNPY